MMLVWSFVYHYFFLVLQPYTFRKIVIIMKNCFIIIWNFPQSIWSQNWKRISRYKGNSNIVVYKTDLYLKRLFLSDFSLSIKNRNMQMHFWWKTKTTSDKRTVLVLILFGCNFWSTFWLHWKGIILFELSVIVELT